MKITTKEASSSRVTFVTHERFTRVLLVLSTILLRKVTGKQTLVSISPERQSISIFVLEEVIRRKR